MSRLEYSNNFVTKMFVFSPALIGLFVCLVMLNATFNNISDNIVAVGLLVEETGEPGENHQPVANP
jgi:hypothetical protein